MLSLGADIYYIVYSSIRGWCVRLNKKRNETDNIYQYITSLGHGVEDIVSLIHSHIELSNQFMEETPCMMA